MVGDSSARVAVATRMEAGTAGAGGGGTDTPHDIHADTSPPQASMPRSVTTFPAGTAGSSPGKTSADSGRSPASDRHSPQAASLTGGSADEQHDGSLDAAEQQLPARDAAGREALATGCVSASITAGSTR